MKFQSAFSLIFILGLVEFAERGSSLCLLTNTAEPKIYWYRCFRSSNYLSDVEAAPIDISRLTLDHAKIETMRNRSFARLSGGLENLDIHRSEIEEIEDSAFEGLGKLRSLDIVESNLQIVKGAWFKGLTSLETVSFRCNEIKHIEGSFFTTVPRLRVLDLTENDLSCLPVASFTGFQTTEFRVGTNPLSWVCLASLSDWLEYKNVLNDYSNRNNIDKPLDLVKTCVKKLPTDELDEELLTKCVKESLTDLLMPQENYTVNELCQFLKDKPSPYLNCSL